MSVGVRVEHLGMSGLRLAWGGASLVVDPPAVVGGPTLITWSETDRVAGVRAGGGDPIAAAPGVLRWLGREGTALEEGRDVEFAGFTLRATSFRPIPYAVPAEAVRKTLSALRSPVKAAGRLVRLAGRPKDLPLVVEVERAGVRVLLAQQALHRFVDDAARDRLVARHRAPDVLIAGTDYEDELATGTLMGAFGAGVCVLADLIGPVRRYLGLPVRPLETTLATAPPGTRLLHAGDIVDL